MEAFIFSLAFTLSLIPVLFWVWFWLREDREKPEPIRTIILTFLAGMAVVPLAIPLQQTAAALAPNIDVLFIWVVVEEVLKYAIALLVIWHNAAVDEPIDMVIYMIVIALGFAAVENTLFLFNPLLAGDYVTSALTSSFRFVGATLLHILASGTIGIFMAFAFYKSKLVQCIAGILGLCIAVALHALFNFFIMDASGMTILSVFLTVWIGIIILFFLFEKVKLVTPHT